MTDTKKNCYRCNGSGQVYELDTSQSLLMGVAIGSGYFPTYSYHTCPSCFGTGKN